MSTRTHRRLAAVALVGGLALAAGACGSSGKSTNSSPTTAKGGAGAPTSDKVTAIPNLTGVGTTVTLDTATAAALTQLKVTVTPTGSATAAKTASGGTAVTFPITSGYAEVHSDASHQPGTIVGSIQHYNSGLKFAGGGKMLELTDFVVDPGNSMLFATVGGMPKTPVAVLDGANVKSSMSGTNLVLDGTVAKLTPTAAQALDSTFGTTAVMPGLALGTVHLVANAANANTYSDKTTEVSRLTGKSTSVTLDTSTLQALTGLGVSAAPSGTGTFDKATGTVGFPITGGFAAIHSDMNYKPGYISGVLIHQGSGLTFTKGAKSLNVSDFVVDPSGSTLSATVGGMVGVPLLALDGGPVKVTTPDGTVHLDGTIASLTDTAATALNTTFGTTALKAGVVLGVVHIIAAGT